MRTKSRAKPRLIGRIAEQTGVNIETIRYYERIALLRSPPRTEGGHRIYDEHDVNRIGFIRRGRELGFSLDEIRALLKLADRGTVACAQTKDLTVQRLADVRGKIKSLRKLERALKEMTDACKPDSQSSCPILDALSANAPPLLRPIKGHL